MDVEERDADFKLGGSIFGLRRRKAALVYTTRRRLGKIVVKIESDISHLPASRCGTAFHKLRSNTLLLASQYLAAADVSALRAFSISDHIFDEGCYAFVAS